MAPPWRHNRAPRATSSPSRCADGGSTTGTRRMTPASATIVVGRRRSATPMAVTATRPTRWRASMRPSGSAAPQRATPATQASSTRVGTWRTPSSGGPATPASSPAVRPHAITGPAAGTARRLAGSEATGSPPKTGISTGATPTWAASVTPSASASGRGPGRRSTSGRASRRIPVVAPTESRKPTERTRSGSTRTSPATARARMRPRPALRPRPDAVAAIAAMVTARSTDGSNRVTSAKKASSVSVTAHRGPSLSRRSSGPLRTSRNATFWPDTASRCVRPAPRKSSATSGGWARSSPITMPVNSARRSMPSGSAPAASVRRSPLARRLAASPGRQEVSSSTVSRPVT